MNNNYNINRLRQEEDNVPLAQYLLPIDKKLINSPPPPLTVMKKRQQNRYFQQPTITLNISQQKPMIRRPSYPATPSSLLDSFSEDEDDEDLVPIAYISSSTVQKKKFQSIADKYKEKVKAQLEDSNTINVIIDDDDLPLSKSCFFFN